MSPTPSNTSNVSTDVLAFLHEVSETRLEKVEAAVAILPELQRTIMEVSNRLGYIQVLEERDRQYRELFTAIKSDNTTLTNRFEEFSRQILETLNSFKDREITEVRRSFLESIQQQKTQLEEYTIKPLKEKFTESQEEVKSLKEKYNSLSGKVSKVAYTASGMAIIIGILWGLLNSKIYDKMSTTQTAQPAVLSQSKPKE